MRFKFVALGEVVGIMILAWCERIYLIIISLCLPRLQRRDVLSNFAIRKVKRVSNNAT